MKFFICVALFIQACFFQSAYSQYYSAPIQSCGCAAGYGLPSNYGYGPYAGPCTSYGGAGYGGINVLGDMGVTGSTAVNGAVPVTGAVTFTGPIPACGSVSIAGNCVCNSPCGGYGYGYY